MPATAVPVTYALPELSRTMSAAEPGPTSIKSFCHKTWPSTPENLITANPPLGAKLEPATITLPLWSTARAWPELPLPSLLQVLTPGMDGVAHSSFLAALNLATVMSQSVPWPRFCVPHTYTVCPGPMATSLHWS